MAIKNLKAYQKKLEKRIDKNPTNHLQHLVQRSATIVENEAVNSIRGGNKTGRVYMLSLIHISEPTRLLSIS